MGLTALNEKLLEYLSVANTATTFEFNKKNAFTAPNAAGVIWWEDFIKNDGEAACKAAGLMRLEGKEYTVKDGDIMHFKFNV